MLQFVLKGAYNKTSESVAEQRGDERAGGTFTGAQFRTANVFLPHQ